MAGIDWNQSPWDPHYRQGYMGPAPVKHTYKYMRQGDRVEEGDKMSRINLDQSLANTPPVWKKFIGSLPPQLAREFVDERPRPDQDDIDFLTPLRLASPQPVAVRVGDLLRHPENQATIGRSPDDVVAAVNQRWGLKVPSGKKYDPNPARYRAYAQMESGTASPSVMADGVILFGAGRFVAAALRGDETMRVWSMTRKQGVEEVRDIVVHEFAMGDVEDPDLYAATPLIEWEKSEQGQWIMKNAVETPSWHRMADVAMMGYKYQIRAKLAGPALTEWLLRYGDKR